MTLPKPMSSAAAACARGRRQRDPTQERRRHGEDHAIADLHRAAGAADSELAIILLDRRDNRTEANCSAGLAAFGCQKIDQAAIAAIDARLCGVSVIHPFVAQRQRRGALGVGRIVALDHAFDGVPHARVVRPGEMPPQEIGDGEILRQVPQRGMKLFVIGIARALL